MDTNPKTVPRVPRFRCLTLAWWLVACCGFSGCSAPQDSGTPEKKAAEPVDLRLTIVDDPDLVRVVGRLRAEWKARSGGTLEVDSMTVQDLRAAKSLGGDAAIYPSPELGLLAERGLITPVPQTVLEHSDLAWPEVFELLRTAECRWGQATYAIPLGSPALTCLYRTDLFEKLNRPPPRTWEQYQQLVEFFANRENLADAVSADVPWFPTLEPLAAGWSGKLLLARAAAYAKHRDNYSALFNIETMEPLVATEPFVRALEELVAAAKNTPPERSALDPAGVLREFLSGHSALALTWPVGPLAGKNLPLPSVKAGLGFVELPGSPMVFDQSGKKWRRREADENQYVTLLGIDGRLGSVSAASSHSLQAFELLVWLASETWSMRVSAASPHTTLYRVTQMGKPEAWVPPGTPLTAARQYARSVQQAMSGPACLYTVRLPAGRNT